ncbi:tandem-95 repeat protein [Christensenellaceae bacterium OttesenSCG-928-K19]|nr:tandem-95 repeat protein [Christensenellaceae bacterium OttesenSCG-928-K19]
MYWVKRIIACICAGVLFITACSRSVTIEDTQVPLSGGEMVGEEAPAEQEMPTEEIPQAVDAPAPAEETGETPAAPQSQGVVMGAMGGEGEPVSPEIVLPDGDKITLEPNTTKEIKIEVTDAVDAPGEIEIDVSCDNAALFDIAGQVLTRGEDGVHTLVLLPVDDATGVAVFTITAENKTGISAVKAIEVTVEENTDGGEQEPEENTAPLFKAPEGQLSVPQSIALTLDLTEYFTDPDGDTLVFEEAGAPQNGTVSITGGVLTYMPDAGFAQTDSFAVRATDGKLTAEGTFTVSVTARTAPVVTLPDGDDVAFLSDETKTLGLTVTDEVDAPGDVAIGIACDNEALFDPAAILTRGEDGGHTLVLAPINEGTGSAEITITATNTAGKASAASLSVTVTKRNSAPEFTAPAGSLATLEETPITITLTDYFEDPDGAALTFAVTGGPQNGTAVVTGDTLTYTPNTNFDRTDTLEVTASDGELTKAGEFTVEVTPVEDAPQAVNERAQCTTAEAGVDIDVLKNDKAVDTGGTLELVAITTNPAYGSAQVVEKDGKQLIRYTPHPRQPGGDVTFNYTVRHAGGTLTSEAAVTVAVEVANNVPVFQELGTALSGTEGEPLIFSFRVKDVDIAAPPQDNIGISIESDNDEILKDENISIQAVYVDDDTVEFNVTLTFNRYANTEEYGNLNLLVTAWDKNETQSSVARQVAVTVAAVNDPPVIQNVAPTFTMDEDTEDSFTFEVYDPDMPASLAGYTVFALSDNTKVLDNEGQDIKVELVSKTGRVAAYGVTLKPKANANTQQAAYADGPVALTISATDKDGETVIYTVSVTVTQVNDSPKAKKVSREINEDDTITFTVTELASDVDGIETVKFDTGGTDAITAEGGTVTVSGDGQTMKYVPSEHYYGEDSFTYTVIDSSGATATATVSIKLNFINYAPKFTVIKTGEDYVTPEDKPIDIVLYVSDVETPKETLAMQVTPETNTGLVASCVLQPVDVNDPGKRVIRVTPAANKNSHDGKTAGFKLVLGDGTTSITEHITLRITPVNDAPTAGTKKLSFTEDVPLTITGEDMLSACADVDIANEGDTLSVTALTNPSHGAVSNIVTDGNGHITSFLYTPDKYYDGTDTITFTVKDTHDEEATGTIVLTGIPVNAPPELSLGFTGDIVINEDESETVRIDFFDPETDLDKLIIAIQSGDESVLNKDSFSYTINEGSPTGCSLTIAPRADQFNEGGVTVRFTISDGEHSVSKTFRVIVKSVPDAPTTPEQEFTIRDATTLYFEPLQECYDPDPDDEMTLKSLTLSSQTASLNGTLVEMDGGMWAYTSEPNFEGDIVLDYEVEDKNGLPSTSTITIHVTNTDIGASIDRLPNVIAFAGMELDPYTLTIRNVNQNKAYDLSVTIAGGGPVNSGSVKLDGGGATLHVNSAGQSPQKHELEFQLSPGVIGDSVVRVTITYINDQGEQEEGVMSFKVTANSNNTLPVAQDVTASCNEGDTINIDVIEAVTDVEDPNKKRLRIQKIDSISSGLAEIDHVDGRDYLRYTTGGPYNARNTPAVVTVRYTVVDSGGATATAKATISITSPNHKPYVHRYITSITKAQAAGGHTFTPDYLNGREYDGDALFLNSVTLKSAPDGAAVDADISTGKLVFTADEPGWYEFNYTVKSRFMDTGDEWDYSKEGQLLIGVYNENGEIPPYLSSLYYEVYEDCGLQRKDITSSVYGNKDGNGSMDVEITIDPLSSNNRNIAQLESYRIDKVKEGNVWKYYFEYTPAENANRSMGGNVTLVMHIAENGKSTESFANIVIFAVNDAPVLTVPQTSAQSPFEVVRGDYETFRVSVTDVDYPEQDKCDEQIRLYVLSSNNNIVNSELCTAELSETPGEWIISVRGFNPGQCTLTVTATDGGGLTHSQDVIVEVDDENRAPVAEDIKGIFNEDAKASATVYNENSDPDGDPLTIELVDYTAGSLPGRASVEGDKITFTPNADFCHSEMFTSGTPEEAWVPGQYVELKYKLKDASLESAVKTVRFHFNAVNDAPRFVALQQDYSMDEGKTGTIKLRVQDVDSTDLSFDCVWDTTDGKVEGIVVSSERIDKDGDENGSIYEVLLSITNTQYECHAANDLPTTITVTAEDGSSARVTANLRLTINPTNDAPLLKAEYSEPLEGTTREDTAIEIDLPSYFWDPDGDSLYIISLSGAQNGVVTNVGNKAKFVPDADFYTRDTQDDACYGMFDYTITDGSNGEYRGSVKILVTPENDAPRLKAATCTTQEDTPLTIDLWTGAYNKDATIWDVDNDREDLSVVSVGTDGVDNATTQGGVLTLNADGTIYYVPGADFNGKDTFQYVVSDGDKTSSATVTVTVSPVNDNPRANFEGTATWALNTSTNYVEVQPGDIPEVCWAFDEDKTGTFSFRVWDPEGNNIITKYTSSAPESLLPKANIVLTGTGENLGLQMTPAKDQYGKFTIQFELSDGTLKQTYTIPVEIRSVNDLPEIADKNETVKEDATLTGSILAKDVETPASALVYSLETDATHGAATVTPTGGYTYVPEANYFGYDEFTIKVVDTDGGASYATIYVSVTPLNDAPTAPSDIEFDKAGYRGGENVSMTWTAGEDLPRETNRGDLKYEVQVQTSAGGIWQTIEARVDGGFNVLDAGCGYTFAMPDVNSGVVYVRMRTWDDGKCYGDLGTTQAPLSSDGWVVAGPLVVDSTAPVATHLLESNTWTNQDVAITLTPADNNPDEVWQSGFSHVVAPAGATHVSGYTYTVAKNSPDGGYVFKLYDNAGNMAEYAVIVDKIDRVLPAISASPGSLPASEGKYVTDNMLVTLTYEDPQDGTGNDAQSGFATGSVKQYKLVKDNVEPAEWNVYGDPIGFASKGTYKILAQVVDRAGNTKTEEFGPYIVLNSAPVAQDKSVEVYRADIENTTGKKAEMSITLAATDADAGDTLTYHWVTTDADYSTLAGYGTLLGSGQSWTLTHGGGKLANDLADLTLTLRYYATDSDVDDPQNSDYASVTVTLHPVNYVPDAPAASSIGPAATTLKSGDPVTITWGDGDDEETAAGDLRYELRYKTSASGSWTTVPTLVGNEKTYTMNVPGVNTEHFQFEVRTVDDNPETRINKDNSTGPAKSGWVAGPVYRIDHAAPLVSYTSTPAAATWTNGPVDVSVSITDTALGASGLATVEGALSGTVTYPADPRQGMFGETRTAADNNTQYTYTATDHVGRVTTKTYKVENIDRLIPSVSASATDDRVTGYAKIPIDVTLTYADAAATAVDGQSGIAPANMLYRTYQYGETPGEYKQYDGTIRFNVRGIYYIQAYCTDNAGNESNVEVFGPYEITNSAPEAEDVEVTVYEHTVSGVGANSVEIRLDAADSDGDAIAYNFTDTTSLGAWGTLTEKTVGDSSVWVLEHDGRRVPDVGQTVELKYKAADDFETPALSDEAKVTVTVVPVNDAPGKPLGVSLTPTGPYKGGQQVRLSWTASTDEETLQNDLVYEVSWRTESGAWDSVETAAGATNADITLPGANTANFQLRVRAKDDNVDLVNPNGQAGPAYSLYSDVITIAVDSTAPTATHSLVADTWTNANTVTITLEPADGSAEQLWQSGFDRVVAPTGVTHVAGYTYTAAKNSPSGGYVFELYDAAGNKTDYPVVVDKLDRIAPTIAANPDKIQASEEKHVTDNLSVALTYDDPADGVGGDAQSGFAAGAKQYKLIKDGVESAEWSEYSAPIALTAKGTYTVIAQTADRADNTAYEEFGPYVVLNSAPVPQNKSADVYRMDVDATKKQAANITLAATDADAGETLTYHWVETDADYIALDKYATLAGSGTAWTLTHKDVAFADYLNDVTLTLRYYATDGDTAPADLVYGTVTVTLHPVNYVPGAPDAQDIGPAAATLKGGSSFTLTWGAGSDLETVESALQYELRYKTAEAGNWTVVPALVGATKTYNMTLPTENTAHFQFEVRTVDDNASTRINPDGTTGSAASTWAASPVYRIDSKAPTATHSFSPADDNGGDVIITLLPVDGSGQELWQSGFNRVEIDTTAEPALSVEDAGAYQYRVTQDGTYHFTLYDNVGNSAVYEVTTGIPTNPLIEYAVTHTKTGGQVAVAWTHDDVGAHYELQVYNGSTWATVIAPSAMHTSKAYTYTVPSGFPDTDSMRFRVRAWDGNGLHSAAWSVGADIVCDSTKPQISFAADVLNTTYTNQSFDVEIDASDNLAGLVSITIKKDGVGSPEVIDPASLVYDNTVTFDANGTLAIEAVDACGNTYTATYTVTNIDKELPQVSAAVTTNGQPYTSLTNYPIRFAMTFADTGVSGLAVREYAFTDSSVRPTVGWEQASSNSKVETRNDIGVYHLHMRAEDKAGNEFYAYIGEYEVYNTVPTAKPQTVTVQEEGSVIITLAADEKDPGDYIQLWTIVDEPLYGVLEKIAEGKYRYTHDGVDPIANTFLTFTATDSKGGESQAARVDIIVQEVNDPPFIHNLTAAETMDGNTIFQLPFDISDADDLASVLAMTVSSSDTSVIPKSGVWATVTPRTNENEGDVVLNIRPARNAYTVNEPVILTIKVRDPEGLWAEQKVAMTIIRAPQPPVARDQYYFVLGDGSVSGSINATPDLGSSIDSYTFGGLNDSAQGTLVVTGDNTFSFGAAAEPDFTGASFPVTIEDANGLSTTITVHLQTRAVSQENEEVNRLVSTVPALSGVDVDEVKLRVASSSNPDVLPAGNVEYCNFLLDETGEIQLYYKPVEHSYGEVVLTLEVVTEDGTVIRTLDIPIFVEPVNDAPIVQNDVDGVEGIVAAGLAGGMSSQAQASAASGVYTVYKNEALTGKLTADDTFDDYDYTCTQFGYHCWPSHAPEHGVLTVEADGSYTYEPDEGYEGMDDFCIMVCENKGWAENKNPNGLESGIIDVSEGGEPRLAKAVCMQVNVQKRPLVENKPEQPNKPDPIDPADPVDPVDPTNPADPEGDASGEGNPPVTENEGQAQVSGDSGEGQSASGNAGAGAGGITNEDDPDEEETVAVDDNEKGQAASEEEEKDSVAIGKNEAAGAALQASTKTGNNTELWWIWLVVVCVILLILLFLLYGLRICVCYEWEEGAQKQVKYFKRIRRAGDDVLHLDITKDGLPEVGQATFTVRFGPLYRHKFYTRQIELVFGEAKHIAEIPDKEVYRKAGLVVEGNKF